MSPFSFLHASDLHLDRPFSGVGVEEPAVAEALREAAFQAFDNLVALALESRVRFVLLAGDLIESQDRNLRAQIRFRDGLRRLSLAGIQTLLVRGESDGPEGWAPSLQWPPGVRIFGTTPEVEVLEWEGGPRVAVSGVSGDCPAAPAGHPRDAGAAFSIGLLHAGRQRTEEGAHPALAESGYDYWALGGRHVFEICREHPWVVYPGTPQGLSPAEPGAHGCCLVEVQEGAFSVNFRPLDAIRWRDLELSIGGMSSVDQLEKLLTEALERELGEAEGRSLLLRVRLVGRGPIYPTLRVPSAVEDLLKRMRAVFSQRKPFGWLEELEVACQPDLDLVARRDAGDFLAQVLRQVEQLRSAPAGLGEGLNPALEELATVLGQWRIQDGFDAAQLLGILNESERLCLDNLEAAE